MNVLGTFYMVSCNTQAHNNTVCCVCNRALLLFVVFCVVFGIVPVQAEMPEIRPLFSTDVAYAVASAKNPSNIIEYSTTPHISDQFAITLASLGLHVGGERYRGSVVLHAGTFADANYTGADSSWKYIQQAFVGVALTSNIWLDAGILPSHMGFEGMVPATNWNYGRSLTADLTPYYETGLQITWQPSASVVLSGLVVNGWQKIIDDNVQKSIGTQLQWKPDSSWLINWSTLVGSEVDVSGFTSTRFYNDLFVKVQVTPLAELLILGDIGCQPDADNFARLAWGVCSQFRYHLTKNLRTACRAEYYSDNHSIFIATNTPYPFTVGSGSVNLDYEPADMLLCRMEARYYSSAQPIFTSGDAFTANNLTVVASLALTLF